MTAPELETVRQNMRYDVEGARSVMFIEALLCKAIDASPKAMISVGEANNTELDASISNGAQYIVADGSEIDNFRIRAVEVVE